MKIYQQRRDLFCKLLKRELGNRIEFETPIGGMAVWVKLNTKFSWASVSKVAKKYNLEIGDWQRYDSAALDHNSIRMGFASYTNEEIYELIHRFKKTMEEIDGKTK